eukprot:SAG31_NODE_5264_length_2644_cov_1.197250_2_plen_139_part_00
MDARGGGQATSMDLDELEQKLIASCSAAGLTSPDGADSSKAVPTSLGLGVDAARAVRLAGYLVASANRTERDLRVDIQTHYATADSTEKLAEVLQENAAMLTEAETELHDGVSAAVDALTTEDRAIAEAGSLPALLHL